MNKLVVAYKGNFASTRAIVSLGGEAQAASQHEVQLLLHRKW